MRTPTALLLDYFPKGIDLTAISRTELQRVADEINERPRNTVGLTGRPDQRRGKDQDSVLSWT